MSRLAPIGILSFLSLSAVACAASPSEVPAETAEALAAETAKVELPQIATVAADDGFAHVQVTLPPRWRSQNPFGGIGGYGSPPFPGWVCTQELLVYPPRCGAWGPPSPPLTPPFPGWVCTMWLLSDPPQCAQWSPPPPALVPPLPGMVCTMLLLSDPPQCGRWEFPIDRRFDFELLIPALRRPAVVSVEDLGFAIDLDGTIVHVVPDTAKTMTTAVAK